MHRFIPQKHQKDTHAHTDAGTSARDILKSQSHWFKGQAELWFSSLQISWWKETMISVCVRRRATWPDTAKSCLLSRSPARPLLNILQKNTTNLSSTLSKYVWVFSLLCAQSKACYRIIVFHWLSLTKYKKGAFSKAQCVLSRYSFSLIVSRS